MVVSPYHVICPSECSPKHHYRHRNSYNWVWHGNSHHPSLCRSNREWDWNEAIGISITRLMTPCECIFQGKMLYQRPPDEVGSKILISLVRWVRLLAPLFERVVGSKGFENAFGIFGMGSSRFMCVMPIFENTEILLLLGVVAGITGIPNI